MLGGDEVYIGAHPLFAASTPMIIADLAAATFDPGRQLDLRASVAFSDALSVGPDKQRAENQRSHQEAMKHADVAAGTLKQLERTGRRIARLIDRHNSERHFRCKCPTGSPRRRRSSMMPISCRVQGWCR
ncbi:hypothetical protein [Mycolicibacterium pallens]|uniref:Uncharacterized protein n=1 Tax=Mycolicibacterium pallens TaxID=370524 RepID=A0ABX8VX08_9MYCO|nr:hypothetical protein [Mycolicibacterium pallens]QYL20209.1 hypothetical protein K0O64_21135 [Mycolicibacterium pallens]